MAGRSWVIMPEDESGNAVRQLIEALSEALELKKPVEVTMKPWRKAKTPPQHRTIWMWHTEVASQLTEWCRTNGHDVRWTAEDVHDLIFKPRYLPRRCKILPNGAEVCRMGSLTDTDLTVDETSDAMEQYLAWLYEKGMSVTIPEDPYIRELVASFQCR